jgi:hypothetical protein
MVHIIQTTMLLINVYHESQIMNTSIGTGYDIHIACIFFFVNGINIHDLRGHIHVGLELLTSHFNLTITTRINTAQPGLGDFFIVYLE